MCDWPRAANCRRPCRPRGDFDIVVLVEIGRGFGFAFCAGRLEPFGGVGQSGYGREMGFDAMREYTQVKSVWVNVDAKIPPWYPR